MTIKASGRSALIIAAGIWACFSGPLQAAPGADSATPTVSKPASKATGAPIVLKKYAKSRHGKYAQRKSSKAALKSSTDKKTTDVADDSSGRSTAIPPSVANANAQLASADAPADSAKAMSAKANTMLLAAADRPDTQPAAEVVAADQLNDLDRALHEGRSATPTLAMASAETAAAPAAPVMASSKEDSAWDQTSRIGKIFLGFGALLTMASAARMFMA